MSYSFVKLHKLLENLVDHTTVFSQLTTHPGSEAESYLTPTQVTFTALLPFRVSSHTTKQTEPR